MKLHQEIDSSKLETIKDMSIEDIMNNFNIVGNNNNSDNQEPMNRRKMAKDKLQLLEISNVQNVADLSVEPDNKIKKIKIKSTSEELMTRFENLEKNFLNKEDDPAHAERI